MKHYTDTIPLELAEKLKAAGMPIILGKRYSDICPSSEDDEMPYQVLCSTTYSEVFDWLMEKNIRVYVVKALHGDKWHGLVNSNDLMFCPTWHEAANAAIEKALELI